MIELCEFVEPGTQSNEIFLRVRRLKTCDKRRVSQSAQRRANPHRRHRHHPFARQFILKIGPWPVPVKTAIASPGRALGGRRWRRGFRESSNHADEIAASSERQAATPQNLTFQSFA